MYKTNKTEREKIENLIDFMGQLYYSKNASTNLDKIHDLLLGSLESKKKSISPDIYTRIKSIINEMDQFMRELKDKDSTITKQQFKERCKKEIFGNDIITDDVSELYDPSLISSDNENTSKRMEKLVLSENRTELSFRSRDRRTIVITKLGELLYQEWNGAYSHVGLYRVQQETLLKQREFLDNLVYTNIILSNMNDEHYRDLVLDKLLDINNILQSNCGGYIGEIIRQPLQSNENDLHDANQSKNYRIDENYILMYDATAVTAAMNKPVSKIQLNNVQRRVDNKNCDHKRITEDYEI